jgi:hypothetical protein
VRVEEVVNSCSSGVKFLMEKLKEVQQNINCNTTGRIRREARAQFKKALYPFKEGSLEKLKKIIEDLRGNLTLAMDTLQL